MVKRLKCDPAKEDAILQAALAAFAQDGYPASTEQIAQAAGVSKGSVFRYFENKAVLFEAAVKQAMETLNIVTDLSVWKNSEDLVMMVMRASQYKKELSHQYPNEFALLLRVYLKEPGIPEELREEVSQIYTDWSDRLIDDLITGLLDKLELRPGLDHQLVQDYLLLAIRMMMVDIQRYLEERPEVKTIDQMEELIKRVQATMDLFEHGIVK